MHRINLPVGCGHTPNTVENFFAIDGHRAWRIDTNPHLVAFDAQDRDRDRLTNVDRFSDAPCQDQHARGSEIIPNMGLAEYMTVYNPTPNSRSELSDPSHRTPFNAGPLQRRGIIPYTVEC